MPVFAKAGDRIPTYGSYKAEKSEVRVAEGFRVETPSHCDGLGSLVTVVHGTLAGGRTQSAPATPEKGAHHEVHHAATAGPTPATGNNVRTTFYRFLLSSYETRYVLPCLQHRASLVAV